MKYNRINIFFDTNKLECRIGKDGFFLDGINLHSDINEIIDFVSINKNVSLYIPEIVWMEMIKHLVSGYKSNYSTFNNQINKYKKSFGSLINIQISENIDDYEKYINQSAEKFLVNHKDILSVVSHSNHEEKFKTIVTNAINNKSPFKKAKGNGKIYSDAGFKDMLIYETIIDNCKANEIGILYTDDRDFIDAFIGQPENKYFVCHTINELKNKIVETESSFIEDKIRKNFLKNEYLKDRLYFELALKGEKVTELHVHNISEKEDDHNVEICIHYDDTLVETAVRYDYIANEIIGINEVGLI